MMLLLLLLAAQPGPDASCVAVTRDLTGADPGSWEEWVASEPVTEPFRIHTLFSTPGRESPRFVILLEEGLSDSLEEGTLEQWAADMEPWTGEVLVAEMSYSAPESLRAWLFAQHALGLEGAVLVGDLPTAWVALDDAFSRSSEMFPADYFYMDLNGVWQDNWMGYPSAGDPGQDGKYDTWEQGSLGPEIFCARIKTSNLTVGTEAGLIQDYLDRVHQWRIYGDPGPHQALCYVDNDWATWGEDFARSMKLLYPDTEMINDLEQTCGTDYEENRLPVPYVWISPFVHSGPTVHQWNPGPETLWSEILSIDPPARFYNLFACSNARFTTPRNMGSLYTFATSSGLAAVGSTKSGSMLDFDYFYQPLGEGAMLGEAYSDWFEFITSGGFTPYEMSWHLGMVLIGDPTLRPAAELAGLPGAPEAGEASALSVAANPCAGSVLLTVRSAGDLMILDISGRAVLSIQAAAGDLALDLDGLPAGVYTAVLRSPSAGTASARFTLLHI